MKADAVHSIMDKIIGHLELPGNQHLQSIVLEMLENGTLKADQILIEEGMVPPSCNKYKLMDGSVLIEGLGLTLPHLAEWLQSLKPKRACLNTLFSALSGISKDAALPSKVIRLIHKEIQEKTPRWAKDLRMPRAGMTMTEFLLEFPLFTIDQDAKTISHRSEVKVAFPEELNAIGGLLVRNGSDFHGAEVGKGMIWVKVALLFGNGVLQAPFFRQEMPRTGDPCMDPIRRVVAPPARDDPPPIPLVLRNICFDIVSTAHILAQLFVQITATSHFPINSPPREFS
jgi:hypothetical protein